MADHFLLPFCLLLVDGGDWREKGGWRLLTRLLILLCLFLPLSKVPGVERQNASDQFRFSRKEE